jgi:hypothetical protein
MRVRLSPPSLPERWRRGCCRRAGGGPGTGAYTAGPRLSARALLLAVSALALRSELAESSAPESMFRVNESRVSNG